MGAADLGEGATVSIGLFIGHDRFSQIALADGNGRVFVTSDPHADTHDMKPRFMLVKEEELDAVDGARFGAKARPPSAVTGAATGESAGTVRAFQGGIVGRDATGRMTWLASWLKTGNRYTLEQMRSPLPASLRQRLEYRDAISIAFLAAYMLPEMRGLLIGFGSGNIFRRLNREAPMGAIRRSIRDTMEARAHGMRASGLEDHFADLMQEAGALDHASGLEAVHGAEPLHLYTSSYSGGYFFAWDSGLEFRAALRSLRIEGNLNRFAAVSAWIERSARNGGVTEDTVTRAQAAQIDLALLDDPALMALPWKGTPRYPESISRTTTAWRRYDTCGGTRARPLTGCFKTIRIPRAGGSVPTGGVRMGVPSGGVPAAAPAEAPVSLRHGIPQQSRTGDDRGGVHHGGPLHDAGKPL